MTHDVFICHSAAEQTLADALAQDLEKKGFISWLAPRDVPRDEKVWSGELRTVRAAIHACKLFLLLLSRSAWESERIAAEASLAQSSHRKICLIQLDADLPESRAFPNISSSTPWQDLSACDGYERRQAIVALVIKILEAGNQFPEQAIAAASIPKSEHQPFVFDPGQSLIFVSYKREDLPRISPILKSLDSDRYTLWLDKKIPGGIEWDSYIEETIKKSALVLLFLSHTAMESKHVRREVKFADRLDKPILSVMLEPVELGQGLEMLLTQFQMIDATRDDFYPILSHSLEAILKKRLR